ncbi:MAG TPA: bacteriohopanetetrol glucosamine biosynthesis glycosyltransferase HpnI [Acidobacteriaceae bacterium]|nr:bacteriohopanetetrol glucosamine biosynthesis glycosyltransferase HpnI [Acidobacteriaceae bacterium]
MDSLALAAEIFTALLTVSGIVYSVMALWAARRFERTGAPGQHRGPQRAGLVGVELAGWGGERTPAPASDPAFTPGITILKPIKGVDPRMHAGLASHCAQNYLGEFEILFGVSSLSDPAVAEVARLRVDNPHLDIRLIECPQRLGPNGKLSNLTQMLPHARFEHILVNDSDILVSPSYLTRIAAAFATSAEQKAGTGQNKIGLVTALYIGIAGNTVWSRLEALGISTDFIPGALVARALEGGLRFGLGSTLATTKSALASIGGFAALTDQLADDYELGVRLHRAGYRIELLHEIVATSVPPYTLRGFCDHQLRWARGTRDSRRAGYLGLGITYVLPWALLTIVASGGELWSLTLFSVALLARIAVALVVGVGLLRDGQVLRDLLLLPLRDLFGLFFWLWSYASNTVVWRGERFRLHRGRLQKLDDS